MKFLWRQVANKGEIKGKSPSMECINGDMKISIIVTILRYVHPIKIGVVQALRYHLHYDEEEYPLLQR